MRAGVLPMPTLRPRLASSAGLELEPRQEPSMDGSLEGFADEGVPPPESAESVTKWVREMMRRVARRYGPRAVELQ